MRSILIQTFKEVLAWNILSIFSPFGNLNRIFVMPSPCPSTGSAGKLASTCFLYASFFAAVSAFSFSSLFRASCSAFSCNFLASSFALQKYSGIYYYLITFFPVFSLKANISRKLDFYVWIFKGSEYIYIYIIIYKKVEATKKKTRKNKNRRRKNKRTKVTTKEDFRAAMLIQGRALNGMMTKKNSTEGLWRTPWEAQKTGGDIGHTVYFKTENK